MSILNPSQTVAVGIGIGVVDAFIFQSHVPNLADVRSAAPQNSDVDATRRQATGLCVAVNGFVSLITRDWDVFLIGGVITLGLTYLAMHANAVDPGTGKMVSPGNAKITPDQDNADAYPLPDYEYSSGSEAM